MNINRAFFEGVKISVPVGIGYFAVSFGFGTLAAIGGIGIGQASLISLCNLTSAGQKAGLDIILEDAGVLTMILSQLIINSRYFLMSMALSQRLDDTFRPRHRLYLAFFNTDEIFALAMDHPRRLSVPFCMGLTPLPLIGWTVGTLFGALAGNLLSASIRNALGVMLYGMFVAIVIPQAKKSKALLLTALISAGLSTGFALLPCLRLISSGLSVVLVTIITAAVCALLFPIPDEEDAEKDQ